MEEIEHLSLIVQLNQKIGILFTKKPILTGFQNVWKYNIQLKKQDEYSHLVIGTELKGIE